MAQIGEGHDAPGGLPQVLTYGSPTVGQGSPTIGEILADRYQVDEHIGGDARGRQLYRGTDVVLRRPVTIVMRYPGGEAASEMLAAAVAASRVVHPHLVGVYDAIDEGERAYVVREWIDGISLREAVAEAPLDPARAIAIALAVAEAVAALHAIGVVHGNVHPGTVMIAQDGRVMLADARADDDATTATDVRAVGGVLYAALTGFWPHAEAGKAQLADGVHEGGRLLSPGKVRDGIPETTDELAATLLDPQVQPADAETVANELRALAGPEEFDTGGLGLDLGAFEGSAVRLPDQAQSRRKIVIVLGALVALALVGMLAAMNFGGSSDDANGKGRPSRSAVSTRPSGQPHAVHLTAGQVRIVAAPGGDRTEVRDAERTVDGKKSAPGWRTDGYKSADFGSKRAGLGVWIDLGSPQQVVNVSVDVAKAGPTIELKGGDSDPGHGEATQSGDSDIIANYRQIAQPQELTGTTVVFNGNDTPVRYLLVWVSKLGWDPSNASNPYRVEIDEITVSVL